MNPESKQGANQTAWLRLDQKYDILGQVKQTGIATLTAKQIVEFRETRLLTKIGERSELPPFLAENHLAVLPLSRSRFAVGHFDAFHDLPDFKSDEIQLVTNSQLLTLQLRPNSEAASLLVALDTGMFDEFLGEKPAKLGIMGRMGSGDFTFVIGGYQQEIEVLGSQIEIDAGIETPSSIALVEAKNTEVGSFLVRQLYYPFRTWTQKISDKKKVRPIFLTVSNDKFRFIEYEFAEPGIYSSIREVRRSSFQLSDSKVSESSFRALMAAPVSDITHGVPYPQADSIDRVVSLLVFISKSEGPVFKDDVAAQQVFVRRQADYYINAARYLGFVDEDRSGQTYFLTQLGKDIVESGTARRTELLLKRITADPVVLA